MTAKGYDQLASTSPQRKNTKIKGLPSYPRNIAAAIGPDLPLPFSCSSLFEELHGGRLFGNSTYLDMGIRKGVLSNTCAARKLRSGLG